ncbi:hypothetical protein HanIR_Chr11g0555231 [Helianthus annuus]|nr:hypothetical protein HanIR_Chr11g0555231 [Helianthus annuus]
MIQDDNQFFHSLSFVSRSTHRLLDTVKKTEIEQPANGFPLEFGKMIMMVLSMLRSGNLPILFDDVKQGEKTLSYVSGARKRPVKHLGLEGSYIPQPRSKGM